MSSAEGPAWAKNAGSRSRRRTAPKSSAGSLGTGDLGKWRAITPVATDGGVLEIAAYDEALRDYVAALRSAAENSGSDSLDHFWRECQRLPERSLRIAAQSWPVFMEWLTIVGGRWARVGTLAERPDAGAVLKGYVGPDREALRNHLGEFTDERLFDVRWRELAAAGDDIESLWKVFQRLASDAVALVRSVSDR